MYTSHARVAMQTQCRVLLGEEGTVEQDGQIHYVIETTKCTELDTSKSVTSMSRSMHAKGAPRTDATTEIIMVARRGNTKGTPKVAIEQIVRGYRYKWIVDAEKGENPK